MKAIGAAVLFVLSGLSATAQAPHVHSDALGFTYTVPEDWQIVAPKPPAQPAKPPQNVPAEVRKGLDCVNVPLTATHGSPASVIVVVTLPYACFGEKMTQQNLAGFGAGVTEGLKSTFDIFNPVVSTYTLAGHTMWIERVKAIPNGKTAPVFTVETACTLLEKGAVCWMAEAADQAGLEEFEHGAVTLEGAAVGQLVPANVFVKSQ